MHLPCINGLIPLLSFKLTLAPTFTKSFVSFVLLVTIASNMILIINHQLLIIDFFYRNIKMNNQKYFVNLYLLQH